MQQLLLGALRLAWRHVAIFGGLTVAEQTQIRLPNGLYPFFLSNQVQTPKLVVFTPSAPVAERFHPVQHLGLIGYLSSIWLCHWFSSFVCVS